uniref:Glutamine--fructose-6-phosphate aminotransferase [isomerizing] n=1 Tax=Thermosporothrix sp. COM3 TaxID=2490863 RepID=A0A455SSV4_9CHLR|nr:hypothetical protein KTC_55410 [Thermosporothrix sp. COM3]
MHYFALDEQIASQPAAVQAVLQRLASQSKLLDPDRPLILVGIGTSYHACRVAAYWVDALSQGKQYARVYSAHEFALSIPVSAEDQVVVVSHRGTKTYPLKALERARQAGAYTIIVTSEETPPPPSVDLILPTCPGERSSTHTVSYLSALAVLATLVTHYTNATKTSWYSALQRIPEAIEQTLQFPAPVTVAEQLAHCYPILVAGYGIDAITAEEAALKLKEGTYIWAEGFELENVLHGPPAAFHEKLGALCITSALDDGGRMQELYHEVKELGGTAFTCGTQEADLLFAPVEQLLRPFVAVVPLQRLVAEIARIRQSNPDTIHIDMEPWKTAMGRVTL